MSFLFGTGQFSLWASGTVNYDSIVTNSINCLLIGSRCIPNGSHTTLCDSSSHQFRELHSVLDRLFRELHRKGIGAVRRQSEIKPISEELSMWDSGVLGTHSPSALLNSVFFLQ